MSAGHYLEYTLAISGVDLSYQYFRADLPKFREPFRRKGILYLGMGFSSFDSTVVDYRCIIDSLKPNVMAIPPIAIDEGRVNVGLCDVGRLYDELHAMSREYAAMI